MQKICSKHIRPDYQIGPTEGSNKHPQITTDCQQRPQFWGLGLVVVPRFDCILKYKRMAKALFYESIFGIYANWRLDHWEAGWNGLRLGCKEVK